MYSTYICSTYILESLLFTVFVEKKETICLNKQRYSKKLISPALFMRSAYIIIDFVVGLEPMI